ncbi:MAG TPA: NUDIX domain-containing protein, partial [Candidatus Acidoferrales bacterium]
GLRRAQRPRPTTTLSALVARRGGRVLLIREPCGIFSGLWHFPYSTGGAKKLAEQVGAKELEPVGTIEHEMTARHLVLRVYVAGVNGAATLPGGRWVRPEQIPALGVGAATRKIAAVVEAGVE